VSEGISSKYTCRLHGEQASTEKGALHHPQHTCTKHALWDQPAPPAPPPTAPHRLRPGVRAAHQPSLPARQGRVAGEHRKSASGPATRLGPCCPGGQAAACEALAFAGRPALSSTRQCRRHHCPPWRVRGGRLAVCDWAGASAQQLLAPGRYEFLGGWAPQCINGTHHHFYATQSVTGLQSSISRIHDTAGQALPSSRHCSCCGQWRGAGAGGPACRSRAAPGCSRRSGPPSCPRPQAPLRRSPRRARAARLPLPSAFRRLACHVSCRRRRRRRRRCHLRRRRRRCQRW